MENKNSFVERQAAEVRETLKSLREQASALEELLVREPDDDVSRDLLEDAQEGIDALEPILADFEQAGVDSEELIKYAADIEAWQGKVREIAEALGK